MPSGDRFGRDPYRQAATLLQRLIVLAPVLHLVFRLGNLVASRLVGLVGHVIAPARTFPLSCHLHRKHSPGFMHQRPDQPKHTVSTSPHPLVVAKEPSYSRRIRQVWRDFPRSANRFGCCLCLESTAVLQSAAEMTKNNGCDLFETEGGKNRHEGGHDHL